MDPPHAHQAHDGIQKRNRKPVSCTPCRQRKLKCDQGLPVCDSCVRRGDVMSCTYQSRRGATQRHWPYSHATSTNVNHRIERLEQLVTSMIDKGHLEDGLPVSSLPQFESLPVGFPTGIRPALDSKSSAIRLDADYGNHNLIGETHWTALLNEIHDVRSYVQTQQKEYENQSQRIAQLLKLAPGDSNPALLVGTSQNLSHGDIISHIPSRYTCDMFVERYFAHLDPALHFLHPPTFRKQYSEYWEHPDKTSIAWIGLLFAVMRIAALSWQRDGDEPVGLRGKCEDLSRSYRIRVADCVNLTDCTKPQEHFIESLALHLFGEYLTHRGADSSCWVFAGSIIRLAMRMGYHRDPSRLPSLTPFQGEMRRRVWAFLCQVDILLSFQHGLPSMVKIESSIKTLPHNIYDDGGFEPGCTELPTPRPNSEATPISYLISKTRLALGLAQALKELNKDGTPPPYERVMEIDRSIRQIYAEVPDHFRLRPLSEQQHDTMILVAARFVLANIYHKSLCVTHSRFLKASRTDNRFAYSRRTCLESAMALLSFQAVQDREIKAGGQTRVLTSYMTSITTHDYLLAAAILCIELSLKNQEHNTTKSNPVLGPSREEIMEFLDRSANIWSQSRENNIEAYKASDVLGMFLNKMRGQKKEPEDTCFPRPILMALNTISPVVKPTAPQKSTAHLDVDMPISSAQQDLPLDHFVTGFAPGRLTPNTISAPGLMSSTPYAEQALPPQPSYQITTGQQAMDPHDPTVWEQFTPLLDFSDPVSTMYLLNSSGSDGMP